MKLFEFRETIYNFHNNAPTDDGGKYRFGNAIELAEKAKLYMVDNLKEVEDKEFDVIKGIKGGNGVEKRGNLIRILESIADKCIESLKIYQNNQIEGMLKFCDFVFGKDGKNIIKEMNVTVVVENTSFYRMRKTDNYEIFDRGGIFALSQSLERLASKLRFSADGLPCLYLASTLYLAWEELRRPDFHLVNFALFKSAKALKVLDLTIPTTFKTPKDFVSSYFALVCSAKTTNDKDGHKFQYTIPNLFMYALGNHISKGGDIDGIKYISSRRLDCHQFEFHSKDIDTAYVFPYKDRTTEAVCKRLGKMFKLSKPRSYFMYKAHRFSFDAPKKAKLSDYDDSLFAEIERTLQNEDLDYYDK